MMNILALNSTLKDIDSQEVIKQSYVKYWKENASGAGRKNSGQTGVFYFRQYEKSVQRSRWSII